MAGSCCCARGGAPGALVRPGALGRLGVLGRSSWRARAIVVPAGRRGMARHRRSTAPPVRCARVSESARSVVRTLDRPSASRRMGDRVAAVRPGLLGRLSAYASYGLPSSPAGHGCRCVPRRPLPMGRIALVTAPVLPADSHAAEPVRPRTERLESRCAHRVPQVSSGGDRRRGGPRQGRRSAAGRTAEGPGAGRGRG